MDHTSGVMVSRAIEASSREIVEALNRLTQAVCITNKLIAQQKQPLEAMAIAKIQQAEDEYLRNRGDL